MDPVGASPHHPNLQELQEEAIAVLTKLGAVNSIPTIKSAETFEKILEVLQGVKSAATMTVFASKSRTLDDINPLSRLASKVQGYVNGGAEAPASIVPPSREAGREGISLVDIREEIAPYQELVQKKSDLRHGITWSKLLAAQDLFFDLRDKLEGFPKPSASKENRELQSLISEVIAVLHLIINAVRKGPLERRSAIVQDRLGNQAPTQAAAASLLTESKNTGTKKAVTLKQVIEQVKVTHHSTGEIFLQNLETLSLMRDQRNDTIETNAEAYKSNPFKLNEAKKKKRLEQAIPRPMRQQLEYYNTFKRLQRTNQEDTRGDSAQKPNLILLLQAIRKAIQITNPKIRKQFLAIEQKVIDEIGTIPAKSLADIADRPESEHLEAAAPAAAAVVEGEDEWVTISTPSQKKADAGTLLRQDPREQKKQINKLKRVIVGFRKANTHTTTLNQFSFENATRYMKKELNALKTALEMESEGSRFKRKYQDVYESLKNKYNETLRTIATIEHKGWNIESTDYIDLV